MRWSGAHGTQSRCGSEFKTHMGFSQEAYDAALVRALEIVADRWQRHRIPRATIFSDAQTAIRRMLNIDVGLGQIYVV